MFSTTVIERPLRVLLIHVSSDTIADESTAVARLANVLSKRNVPLAAPTPIVVANAADLPAHAETIASASCIVIVGSQPAHQLEVYQWLDDNVIDSTFAVTCAFGIHDTALTDAVLKSSNGWAPIAIAQESDITLREGALFLAKFLAEMHLHTDGNITGRMAWFSWKKAGELLKRRRSDARFGLRA
jgi:hypothetical protein